MNMKLEFTNGKQIESGIIYGIGQNYAEHARELGGEVPKDPVVFIKPGSALLADGGTVLMPEFSDNVHHEVELVIVLGKDCSNVSREDAADYIAGFAIGIDVTLRDIQFKAKEKGHPWSVAKGFRTSAPISKIIPYSEINDTNHTFQLELYVNDEQRQCDKTSKMERQPDLLIEYLSSVFDLRKGDMIYTGTPKGVSKLNSGDKVKAVLKDFLELNINIR
jgi:2-keto-4-pentenoate hydratase/2-oxohepta-3-ene-1,7-dioic acid hydratase in catechol pathway